MGDIIWIVITAGGNSREKEKADKYNAKACQALSNLRIEYNVDIVSAKRLADACSKLRGGERIALHQGGSKRFRKEGFAAGWWSNNVPPRYHQ